jgi:hypothetical protein
MDGWRDNTMKTKKVRLAIRTALTPAKDAPPTETSQLRQDMARDDYPLEALTDVILDLAKHQSEY